MKKRNIVIGLALILVAGLIFLDALGVLSPVSAVVGEISLISLLLGGLLLVFCIWRIAKLSFPPVIVALALLFLVFEKNVAFLCGLSEENIINDWILLLVSVIFAIGLKLILPKRQKKEYSSKLGESTVYLDSTKKQHFVKNSLGECKVYFENVDAYEGGSTLNISNKLGETTILVPSGWHVVSKVKNSLGEYNLPRDPSPEGAPVLYIVGSNKLGETRVIYI